MTNAQNSAHVNLKSLHLHRNNSNVSLGQLYNNETHADNHI